jgi:hypothetical protein
MKTLIILSVLCLAACRDLDARRRYIVFEVQDRGDSLALYELHASWGERKQILDYAGRYKTGDSVFLKMEK